MFHKMASVLFIIIIVTFYLNEINCRVLDISRTGKSSMVRRSVDSLDDSIKINSTLSWVPKVNGYSIEASNLDESNETKRKPKFARLAFLTGLGIGSLANSPLYDTNSDIAPNTIPSLKISTSTMRPVSSNILSNTSVHNSSLDGSSYSDNFALLNQSLRSITQILERFTMRMNRQEEIYTERPAAESPQEPFEVENIDDNVNDNDESPQIRVYKQNKNETILVNFSELENLIRASVAHEFKKNRTKPSSMHKKPHVSEDEESNKPHITMNETLSTSTTAIPITTLPPVTETTKFPGYFGGNSQNISGVDIALPWYGPPENQRPPQNQIHYAIPAYAAAPFPPEHYQEPYETYYHGSPSDTFPAVPDPWSDYNGRGRHLSSIDKNKVLINGSGFVPSKLARHS